MKQESKPTTSDSMDHDGSAQSADDDDFFLLKIAADRSHAGTGTMEQKKSSSKENSTRMAEADLEEKDHTDRSEDAAWLLQLVAERSHPEHDGTALLAAKGMKTDHAPKEAKVSDVAPTLAKSTNPTKMGSGMSAMDKKRVEMYTRADDTKPSDSGEVAADSEAVITSATGEVVDTVSLSRQAHVNHALPGAYRSANGMDEHTGAPARPNAQQNEIPTIAVASTEQNADTTTTPGELVVANEVTEGCDLENAMPVDPASTHHKNDIFTRGYVFGCALGWLALAMALVVGLVFAFKGENADALSSTTAPAPTEAPTMTPTEAPTMKVTEALDALFDTLPDYTQDNISNFFGSPQYQAWDWLSNHPDLSTFPLWKQTQLFALATFFYAFEGPNWRKPIRERWLDYTKDECLWFSSGFGYFDDYTGEYMEESGDDKVYSCSNNNTVFTSLHLENLRLGGFSPVIPPEIFLLTSLSRIDLNVNNISMPFGTMWPSVDVEFPSLVFLSFFANKLHSTLPTIWGRQLVNLEKIRLYDNALTGPIPSELMQLTSMTSLTIQYSYLTGSLPTQLALMTELLELAFHNNLLSGPIPTEIGLLTLLKQFDVDVNQLTGTIPSEIGVTSIQILGLADNLIHGSIPSQLGLLESLKQLKLQNNMLTGTIPFQLNSSIPGLNLGGNDFSGLVPKHLCEALACNCTTNDVPVSSCMYLMREPEWPGRLPNPPANNEIDGVPIMINIKTDLWPEETKWTWEQSRNGSKDVWETVEGSDGTLRSSQFLHSYPVVVAPNITYRLTVSDIYSDGIYAPGYITLADANGTALFSIIGRDSFIGDPASNFANVSVLVLLDDQGLVEAIQV